jgi:Glycosyl transferase family 2
MSTISIVTPVYDGGQRHLLSAWESLCAQEMPPGWDWEWVVQEDGETGSPLRLLPDDQRISGDSGRRGNAAVARTLALSRAKGVLVRPLDADDELTPGALARDIKALTSNPGIGWCVSAGLDLMPDGSLIPAPDDFPEGPLGPSEIFDSYAAGIFRVIACTLTAHTSLVRAVGGWGALPASEDVSLLVACETVSRGWMVAEPSMHYRKHSTQSTRLAKFNDSHEIAARRASIIGRREALNQAGWTWNPKSPLLPVQKAA